MNNKKMMKKLKSQFIKSLKGLSKSLPILLIVVLLISLFQVFISSEFYKSFFGKNAFSDTFLGSLLGSIMAGNPITSYILGGEFLNQGVSLIAVSAFLVSWVTVGVIQMPAEAKLLGKKFSIVRNITAFVLSIIVALIVQLGVNLL